MLTDAVAQSENRRLRRRGRTAIGIAVLCLAVTVMAGCGGEASVVVAPVTPTAVPSGD